MRTIILSIMRTKARRKKLDFIIDEVFNSISYKFSCIFDYGQKTDLSEIPLASQFLTTSWGIVSEVWQKREVDSSTK